MVVFRGAAQADGRIWPLAAVVAALLVVMNGLVLLLDVPLVDPSEGLHAAIAQEMVERGDWITPRLFGQPFRDKPILFFWAEAAALATLGMSVAAFRLPGVLFAMAGAVTTGLVGRRLFDSRTGLLAAGFHATMLLPTALAQAPVHDVALVPLVNLAILGLWDADHATTWRRRLAVGSAVGMLLGLATLVKGLPGVAVVGVAYGILVVANHGTAVLRRIRGQSTSGDGAHPPLMPIVIVGGLALAVGGLVAAPWYLVREARDPGFLHYFFVERHVGGFTAAGQCHDGRPWWYYVPILLLGGMPAIAYVPAAFAGMRDRGPLDRRLVLLAGWLCGGAIFFSAANSKLITYVWPLAPAIALLAAVAWGRIIAGTATPATRWRAGLAAAAVCLGGLPALPAATLVAERFAGIDVPAAAWALILPVMATTLVPLALWRHGRPEAAVAAGWGAMAAHFVVLMTVVFAPLARTISSRDLAAAFNERGHLPSHALFVAERPYSLFFSLDPALRRTIEPGRFLMVSPDVARARRVAPPEEIVIYPRRLAPDQPPVEVIGRWWLYGADAIGADAIGVDAVVASRR